MPIFAPTLRSRRAHAAARATRDNPAKLEAYGKIAPRPRHVDPQASFLAGDRDLYECFYHTSGMSMRAAWSQCNSPHALLALCANIGVNPRLIAWAIQECVRAAWSEAAPAYGRGAVVGMMRRSDDFLSVAIDDAYEMRWAEYLASQEERSVESNSTETMGDVIEEVLRLGPPERVVFLQDRETQRRIARPLKLLRLLYFTLEMLWGMRSGEVYGPELLRTLPSRAQVFLDDSMPNWRSFRKTSANIIRSVIPWWYVAVKLSEADIDLGEPLWFSVTEEFLPGTALKRERDQRDWIAQNMEGDAEAIESTARGMVRQEAWLRTRAASAQGEQVEFNPLRGYVEPYL